MELDLARGLVSSYASELVRDRARVPMIGFTAVGVAMLLVALIVRGGFGVALVVVGLLVLGVAVLIFLLRGLALFSIRKVARPVPDFQQRVAEAIEGADLPTGPLSIVRLLNRLRKGGVDDEIDRLKLVLGDLNQEFDPGSATGRDDV